MQLIKKNVVFLIKLKTMRKLIIVFLITFSIHNCYGQLSKEDFINDLNYLKSTLPQKHTNLFSKITEQDFDTKINNIIAKSDSLNYETFTAELLKLIVSIRDEHTQIEFVNNKIFPIQFEGFKEGIYVKGIDSTNSDLLGTQLTAINNIPIETIIDRYKQVILSENQSFFDVRFLHYLNSPVFLKGLGINKSTTEILFTLKSLDRKETKVLLKSIPISEKQKLVLAKPYATRLSSKNKSYYFYEYIKGEKVLYFNYNSCRDDVKLPFVNFNNELFSLINSEKPEKIIIDLRNNSGGNSGILRPFIDSIANSYLNKKGKLFVLIGKQTFSSAVMNAVALKRNTAAILVGESTSGNINHYGEVRGFALPKSKIVIAYSTKYWENWKGKKGALIPDVKINYSFKNFSDNKDEAIEYVYSK